MHSTYSGHNHNRFGRVIHVHRCYEPMPLPAAEVVKLAAVSHTSTESTALEINVHENNSVFSMFVDSNVRRAKGLGNNRNRFAKATVVGIDVDAS